TRGLAERISAAGGEIRERCAVEGFERRNGGWSLRAAGDELRVDRVVLAAGLGSVPLLRSAAVTMPLLGPRGYSVPIDGRGTPPAHALYVAEAKLGLSAYNSGVRVAGVFELGAREATAPQEARRKLIDASRPYLAGWSPDGDETAAVWAGLRPTTADGLPL